MINIPIDKIVKPILITGIVVGGVWYLNGKLKDSNARTAEAAIDNSPEATQADSLFQMLHPYGSGMLSWYGNVDEAKVVEFAKKIKDINKVVSYYSAISKGKSLYDDLRYALNEDEYNKFKANIQGSASAPSPVKKIVSAQTTAGNLQLWNDYEFKSGLTTVKKGVQIGTTLKAVKYYSDKLKATINIYYVHGDGIISGKKFYVLQSQVKLM